MLVQVRQIGMWNIPRDATVPAVIHAARMPTIEDNLLAVAQKLNLLVGDAVGWCDQWRGDLLERRIDAEWDRAFRRPADAHQDRAALFVTSADEFLDCNHGFFVANVEIDRRHPARETSSIFGGGKANGSQPE